MRFRDMDLFFPIAFNIFEVWEVIIEKLKLLIYYQHDSEQLGMILPSKRSLLAGICRRVLINLALSAIYFLPATIVITWSLPLWVLTAAKIACVLTIIDLALTVASQITQSRRNAQQQVINPVAANAADVSSSDEENIPVSRMIDILERMICRVFGEEPHTPLAQPLHVLPNGHTNGNGLH